MPAVGIGLGAAFLGGRLGITLGVGIVPAGYTRSTINGAPVTYLGRPVFDNGSTIIYLGA